MAGNAGKDIYFYEADSADTHIVRLDDVTLTLNVSGTAQIQPAGPATSPFWAKVSRGKNEYGLKPRTVGVCFTTTAPGTLETGVTYDVVVLTQTDFAAATINSTATYQGEEVKIVNKTPESIYPGI